MGGKPSKMTYLGSTYYRGDAAGIPRSALDLETKLSLARADASPQASCLAPPFSPQATYAGTVPGRERGQFVTFEGALWECVRTKSAPSDLAPPDDLYEETANPMGHWARRDLASYLREVDFLVARLTDEVAALREDKGE